MLSMIERTFPCAKHDPTGLNRNHDLVAWPEHDAFDALHKRSESLGHWKAYLLFAMVVTAAWRGGAEKKQSGGIRRMKVLTPVP